MSHLFNLVPTRMCSHQCLGKGCSSQRSLLVTCEQDDSIFCSPSFPPYFNKLHTAAIPCDITDQPFPLCKWTAHSGREVFLNVHNDNWWKFKSVHDQFTSRNCVQYFMVVVSPPLLAECPSRCSLRQRLGEGELKQSALLRGDLSPCLGEASTGVWGARLH